MFSHAVCLWSTQARIELYRVYTQRGVRMSERASERGKHIYANVYARRPGCLLCVLYTFTIYHLALVYLQQWNWVLALWQIDKHEYRLSEWVLFHSPFLSFALSIHVFVCIHCTVWFAREIRFDILTDNERTYTHKRSYIQSNRNEKKRTHERALVIDFLDQLQQIETNHTQTWKSLLFFVVVIVEPFNGLVLPEQQFESILFRVIRPSVFLLVYEISN